MCTRRWRRSVGVTVNSMLRGLRRESIRGSPPSDSMAMKIAVMKLDI